MIKELNKFQQSEAWLIRGNAFAIEVKHWSFKDPFRNSGNRNMWNVYVYIYESHPKFNDFNEENICGGSSIDFHGGCTYCEWLRDDGGKVKTKKYGCDYAHYMDDEYANMETKEDAISVFIDALEIFNKFEEREDKP
jgi:hypothetical protein